MSEEFESEPQTEDSGINPIGKYLIYAVVLIVVIATVYGIFHTGIDLGVNREGSTASNNDGIDLAKLRAEARPTPTIAAPIQRTAISVLEPQQRLLASPTPAPQRAPDPMEQWRMQEALKAREASPIVAAFQPQQNNTKEIPSVTGQSKLQAPASPWTINEGTVIQAVLLFGVNSDYPGDLVAQIERPIYDSATGRYPLIPAGSKLIGKFQQPSGPFQERIAIGWHRLLLPNNWSMPLPQMPSTDGAGYAGVTGDVNHHYPATLGAALLTSLLSVGSAMGSVLTFSSAQTSPYGGGVYQTNPEQQMGMIAANSAGGQMSSTSSRFLQPYLNRPNTVTIPPGTRFDVFVNSDLVMPGPYADSAGHLINANRAKVNP
jgi:type IV secretory pathway VirB10-like protein